jgi:hypothetical protein
MKLSSQMVFCDEQSRLRDSNTSARHADEFVMA